MNDNEKEIAEIIRIEYNKDDDRLFLVFEVSDLQYKKILKEKWTDDIEFRLIDKKLVLNDV